MPAPETLILLHFLAGGAQGTVTRMASRRRINNDTLALLTSGTTLFIASCLLAMVLLVNPSLTNWEEFPWYRTGIYSLIFTAIGGVYFLVIRLRYNSQSLLPSFIYEPMARLHVFIVVPISIIFLEDGISGAELGGIILALVTVLIIGLSNSAGGKTSGGSIRDGLITLVLAGILAAALQLAAKVLMAPELLFLQIPVLVYVIGSNLVSSVIAGLQHLPKKNRSFDRSAIKYGISAGVFNMITLMSLLIFLIDGKASRIYSIGAMSMLLPILFNLIGQHDRWPKPLEWLALGFALAALLLQANAKE